MARQYNMRKRADTVEAMRAKIVEATYEEHGERGIVATSHESVAKRAGVAVGTVYRHFPSYDDLVVACGGLTFERMALPAIDEMPALFDGATGEARLERLVVAVFGIYERGADPIEEVRREHQNLPHLLARAHEIIETTLTRLIGEGLADLELSDRQEAVVRSLLDVPTWRALRAQGVTGGDSTEAVVALCWTWIQNGGR